MTRTVDIVIVGANAKALAAAIESARRGRRVLMVVRSQAADLRRRLRRSLRAAGAAVSQRVSILSGAEVECVAGVRAVEAVLLRRIGSNRGVDVNASALLNLDHDRQQ